MFKALIRLSLFSFHRFIHLLIIFSLGLLCHTLHLSLSCFKHSQILVPLTSSRPLIVFSSGNSMPSDTSFPLAITNSAHFSIPSIFCKTELFLTLVLAIFHYFQKKNVFLHYFKRSTLKINLTYR